MGEIKDRPELTALIEKAKARFATMTPEEQEAELIAQRESWVRGEMAMGEATRAEARQAPGQWFDLTGDARLGGCATDGCGGQPTVRLEAGGIGANYCSGCAAKIRSRQAPLLPAGKLDGNEIWEWLFGTLKGDVPDALTGDLLDELALWINSIFATPAPLPAGAVTEEMVERAGAAIWDELVGIGVRMTREDVLNYSDAGRAALEAAFALTPEAILSMSEDELYASVRARGEDPVDIASHIRGVAEAAFAARPAEPVAVKGLDSALRAAEAYIDEYEWDDGESHYVPTEIERLLMLDMVNGLFSDDGFLSHLRPAPALGLVEALKQSRKLLAWAADSFAAQAKCSKIPDEIDALVSSEVMYRDAAKTVAAALSSIAETGGAK